MLPTAPLSQRADASGTWTGQVLVVAGGLKFKPGERQRFFRDAAAYNPASNTWRKLPAMPQARASATAVWDGREVLFLGGFRPRANGPARSGMAYNPATNRWRLLPAMQFARSGFAAVWTGRHVLVWGGRIHHPKTTEFFRDGAAFAPLTG
jgi:N-acetylneuraminic acid mutarotase